MCCTSEAYQAQSDGHFLQTILQTIDPTLEVVTELITLTRFGPGSPLVDIGTGFLKVSRDFLCNGSTGGRKRWKYIFCGRNIYISYAKNEYFKDGYGQRFYLLYGGNMIVLSSEHCGR